MKEYNKYRGFLLTSEGIIALSIVLIVLGIITNQTFQSTVPRGTYLKQISFDVLKVLDYDGRIGKVIDGNTTAVREILENSQTNICMQLNIESTANSSNIITIAKPNCNGFKNELQTTYRTTIYNNVEYVSTLQSWYNNWGKKWKMALFLL